MTTPNPYAPPTAEEDEDPPSTGDCPAHHHRVEVLRHELQDRLDQCFVIGGPFVRYDPDCPVHGLNRDRARDALTRERDLSDRLAAALREHQWDGSHHAPYDDGTCDHYCTTCSADASDGHTDDCAVFLALAEHAAARNKEEP
jgi:hypothetical protein